MVKKKAVKKKAVKKKPVTKKKKVKKSRGLKESFKLTKARVLSNFIRFFIFFVVCLVLYFVTGNYVLWALFLIGAIIGGAISFALLLILIGFAVTKKK